MAGIVKVYAVGEPGGFLGADGLNPVHMVFLVGTSGRMWLEACYLRPGIQRMGSVRCIVPAGPEAPSLLLDACIAFWPARFADCPSLGAVRSALGTTELLDFDRASHDIPKAWSRLRSEALPTFETIHIMAADLEWANPARLRG